MADEDLILPRVIYGNIHRPCWEVAETESNIDVSLNLEEIALNHRDRFAHIRKDTDARIYGSAGIENAPEATDEDKSNLRWANFGNIFVPRSREIPTVVYVTHARQEQDPQVVAHFREKKITRSITDIKIQVHNNELCTNQEEKLKACRERGLLNCELGLGAKQCEPVGLVGTILGTLTRIQDEQDPNLCTERYEISAITLRDYWETSNIVPRSIRDGIFKTMYNSAVKSIWAILEYFNHRPLLVEETAKLADEGDYYREKSEPLIEPIKLERR